MITYIYYIKKYYAWGSTRKEYEKYECETSLGATSFILLYVFYFIFKYFDL